MKTVSSVQGFYPYLLALFLNAFTDLGHKILIQNTIFKIYDGSEQIMYSALINSLILLPFVLIFSPAGFLASKYAKDKIMRFGAVLAIVITLLITASYYMGWFEVSFILTFFLAFQSAIYSPAKYGYIKELVGEKLISSANAAVQATTIVAILGGIMFYTVLFENSLTQAYTNESEILVQMAPLGWLLVLGAVLEYLETRQLPHVQPNDLKAKFEFKRYRRGYYLRKNIRLLRRKETIFASIIALSFLWAISQVLLASFGAYAKEDLGLENTIVVQGIVALSAVGIIIGSIIAARYSHFYIKLGLAPFGALGMTLCVVFLPLLTSVPLIALLFTFFGIFSGFIIVPLNSYIQKIAPRVHFGTILAGNNFIQNIFMVTALLATTLFAYFDINVKNLFMLIALAGLLMTALLIKRYFMLFLSIIIEFVFQARYKYEYEGLENIPEGGAVLMLGNHVSWVDWIILQIPIERRIRFLMDREYYEWKYVTWFFKLANAIPVSTKASKDAFVYAKESLKNRELLAVFPEGRITSTGEMNKFHRGYEIFSKDRAGKILPFYIDGMYGSVLTRASKRETKKRWFHQRVVKVIFGETLEMNSTAEEVKIAVTQLKDNHGIK